jgi:hypothetical protein
MPREKEKREVEVDGSAPRRERRARGLVLE